MSESLTVSTDLRERSQVESLGLADVADINRIGASFHVDPELRSTLGQFMTPTAIARYMASRFDEISDEVRLLDPGAGVGVLTAAFLERCIHQKAKPESVSVTCYEIDPGLMEYLDSTTKEAANQASVVDVSVRRNNCLEDFILAGSAEFHTELIGLGDSEKRLFTHVIMNPPYKKINAKSRHRLALRSANLETSNLYTGFMYLAAHRLVPGGEMVAIVPRSFCNGTYFTKFRKQFFSMMTLREVHLFEKRNSAFKSDGVLQENIILHAIRNAPKSRVRITTSSGGHFQFDQDTQSCFGGDITQNVVDYDSVIRHNDPNMFVHLISNRIEQGIVSRMSCFHSTLDDLNVRVSTGPVVQFRLRKDLRGNPGRDTVPLLHASHFQDGGIEWPSNKSKSNAIKVSKHSQKWLMPNNGYFVLTRRFSTKEERKRIVAVVYRSNLPGDWVGFENHLNVFHENGRGMPLPLAIGLRTYLNCSLVDRYFRQFNGHTQVNAMDLRSIPYPDREILERLGATIGETLLSQDEIDELIEREISHMTNQEDPLRGQRKIDQALGILKVLGMPRAQQNDRSALTLLALLDLRPKGSWKSNKRPLMGITPIMEYCREVYGREYAPNTRETFRRQTMHQFVEAGIARYNPDDPARPVNSPHACYQISEEIFEVLKTYGTNRWESALNEYLERKQPLSIKWAMHREMQQIPVHLPGNRQIELSPGLTVS